MHEFETVILESTSDVDAFLTEFPTDESTADSLYSVDYSDSLTIGIFTGSRPNTSYAVNVDSVMVSSERSLVYVTESGSDKGF